MLPCAGGVYIEGMESGDNNFMEKKQLGNDSNKTNVKTEPQSHLDKDNVKKDGVKMEIKTEIVEDKTETNSVLLKNSENTLKEEVHKDNCDGSLQLNKIKEDKELCNNVHKVSDSNKKDGENSTSELNKIEAVICQSESANNKVEQSKIIPNGECKADKEKSQPGDDTGNDKTPPHSVSVSGNDTQTKCISKNVELKIPSIKPCAISSHDSTNLFLHVPSSTKLSDFCNISSSSDSKTLGNNNLILSSSSPSYISSTHLPGQVTSSANQISDSLSSTPKPPPAHSSKSTTETKPSFMSIDSILMKKTETSETNQFFPPGVAPLSPYTNTLLKGISDSPSSDGRPWFSILPRVPCDDMSLTRGQHQSFSAGMFTSSPYMSSFRSFPVLSPTFSSFQMGQILGNSLPGTPGSSGLSTPVNDPFKVPDVPSNRSQSPDPEEVLKTLQGEAKPIPEGKSVHYVPKIRRNLFFI